MTARRLARLVLVPLIAVLAVLYFLIDALFLSIIRIFAARLSRLPVFERMRERLRALGPYPTLALFLLPLILLEPLKPMGLYLIARRHAALGTIIICIAELLKIFLVERLFHMSRGKLMSIAAFARVYRFITAWLAYLEALPPWQAVLRMAGLIKSAARRIMLAVRNQL